MVFAEPRMARQDQEDIDGRGTKIGQILARILYGGPDRSDIDLAPRWRFNLSLFTRCRKVVRADTGHKLEGYCKLCGLQTGASEVRLDMLWPDHASDCFLGRGRRDTLAYLMSSH